MVTSPMKALFLCSGFLLFALPLHADRFEQWDRNGDGKLQKEELPPGARRNFERVDTDQNGTISREEHNAFIQRGRADRGAGHDDYRIERNLDYVGSGNDRQRVDLFLPTAKSDSPRPLLLYIHGGGWRQGSKEHGFKRLLPFLEAKGLAGACINYRLSNEASWPAQIHDCKAAIRWLKANAEKYGYDPGKIAVWGTSAGGHLAGMLGVSGDVPSLEGFLGKHLDENSRVACVVNYFGPANLQTMDNYPSSIRHNAPDSPEGRLLGGAITEKSELAANASPVTHVSKGDAPMILVHGTDDKLVPYPQSVEFSRELRREGVQVALITMEGAGHGFRSDQLVTRVSAFLGVHLRGETGEIVDHRIARGD